MLSSGHTIDTVHWNCAHVMKTITLRPTLCLLCSDYAERLSHQFDIFCFTYRWSEVDVGSNDAVVDGHLEATVVFHRHFGIIDITLHHVSHRHQLQPSHRTHCVRKVISIVWGLDDMTLCYHNHPMARSSRTGAWPFPRHGASGTYLSSL